MVRGCNLNVGSGVMDINPRKVDVSGCWFPGSQKQMNLLPIGCREFKNIGKEQRERERDRETVDGPWA